MITGIFGKYIVQHYPISYISVSVEPKEKKRRLDISKIVEANGNVTVSYLSSEMCKKCYNLYIDENKIDSNNKFLDVFIISYVSHSCLYYNLYKSFAVQR